MKIGLLYQDKNVFEIKDFNDNNLKNSLEDFLKGNLEYIPLKTLLNKKVNKNLKDIHVIINKDGLSNKSCIPNLLIGNDFVLGNIAFVNIIKENRKKVQKDLDDSQFEELKKILKEYRVIDMMSIIN